MGFGDARSDEDTARWVMAPAQMMLDKIAEVAAEGDFEKAHSLEDELLGSSLTLISTGELDGPECVALAKLVLKSTEIVFQRACA